VVIPRRASTAVRAGGTPSPAKELLNEALEGEGTAWETGKRKDTPFGVRRIGWTSRIDAASSAGIAGPDEQQENGIRSL
jgi:hypothetical protein